MIAAAPLAAALIGLAGGPHGLAVHFHFSASATSAPSTCASGVSRTAVDGGSWTGVATAHPGDDGTRVHAQQGVLRENVGGLATVDAAGSATASFWFLVVVDRRDGTQSVLSVRPADTHCAPLRPVTGSTYAAQWTLAGENGAPPSATGAACVTLAGAYDVTIALVSCVPPTVELETSARASVQRNTVSLGRLRRLDAAGTVSRARAETLLGLAPLVVAATATGDGVATTLAVDGRPLSACPASHGQIGIVWELGGAHSLAVRATSPAGTAAAAVRITATTTVAGAPLPATAAGRAALARRLHVSARTLELLASLEGAAAPPSLCPRPGR